MAELLFDKVLKTIEKNKEYKSKGIQTNIPYPYPRLNEYLVGIDKGQAIGVLGSSGIGKSKIVRYTFVYNVYRYYKQTGYKTRIIAFCMEDTKERWYNFMICNYLKEEKGIDISIKELLSKSREFPDFALEELREARSYFEELEQIVTFIDGVTEPTETYQLCRKIALKLGKVDKKTVIVEGQEVKQYEYHSDTHVIAIFDNMSNIDTEDGTSNEQAAILKFVKDYMRLKLCNFFQWTCVMVMQLDFESEKQNFTKSGESIVAKLEPGLHSVGDSKRSTRSFHLIFSLFSPSRYDLLKYPIPPKDKPLEYYDINILGNRFRSLRIIKANDTDVGMRVPLLFNGMSEIYTELPPPNTPELAQIYSDISGTKWKPVNTFKSEAKLFIDDVDDELAPF